MPRIRSLVTRIEFDVAKRAHSCHGNRRHRIIRGDNRVNVIEGRRKVRYCLECASKIVERDRAKLEQLDHRLQSIGSEETVDVTREV